MSKISSSKAPVRTQGTQGPQETEKAQEAKAAEEASEPSESPAKAEVKKPALDRMTVQRRKFDDGDRRKVQLDVPNDRRQTVRAGDMAMAARAPKRGLAAGGDDEKKTRAEVKAGLTGRDYDKQRAASEAVKADKPGAIDGARDALKSTDGWTRATALNALAEVPGKLNDDDARAFGKIGGERSAGILSDMARGGNTVAQGELNKLVDKAPQGYEGDRIRREAGISDNVHKARGEAVKQGFKPLSTGTLRDATSADAKVRDPALKALGDDAVKGHPQAIAALTDIAAGDAPEEHLSYGSRDPVHAAAAKALEPAAAKLNEGQVKQLLQDTHYEGPKAVLMAGAKAGSAPVLDVLRKELDESSYVSGDKGEIFAAGRAHHKGGDHALMLKAGFGVADAVKGGDKDALKATNDALLSTDHKVAEAARSTVRAAPEHVNERTVDQLKAIADKGYAGRGVVDILEDIGSKDTPLGAKARGSLDALSKSGNVRYEAKEALEDAKHAILPEHEKPLNELRDVSGSWGMNQPLADRLVSSMDKLGPEQRREVIDTLQKRVPGDLVAMRALGKMAPHLSDQDVNALIRSDTYLPEVSPTAQRFWDSRKRKAHGEKVDRNMAKQAALTDVINGGKASHGTAAANALLDQRFDRLKPETREAIEKQVSESGDLDLAVKLKRTVPDAAVSLPPDAHEKLTMTDKKAKTLLEDPAAWARLDASDGRRAQGRVSRSDLGRAAADPTLPPEVRAAAGHLANPEAFARVAGRDGVLNRGEVAPQGTTTKRHIYSKSGYRGTIKTENTGGETMTRRQMGAQEHINRFEFSGDKTYHLHKHYEHRGNTSVLYKQTTRTTRTAEPDDDVTGVDLFHGIAGTDSPQDLRDGMGGKLRREITESDTVDRVSGTRSSVKTDRRFKVNSQGQVTKELTELDQGAGSQWIARKRNADGSYDSQMFIQGTDDTSISKSTTTADGFKQTTSEARFGDTRAAIQKANKERAGKGEPAIPVPPKTTNNVEAYKDNASVADLDNRLSAIGLAEADKHKAVQGFKDAMKGQPFSLAYSKSSDSDGGKDAMLTATGKDGTKLVVNLGDGGEVVSQSDVGQDHAMISTSRRGRGQTDFVVRRDESGELKGFVATEGGALTESPDLTRSLLGDTKVVVDLARTAKGALQSRAVRQAAGTALRGAMRNLEDSKFLNSLHSGFGGLSVGMGVMSAMDLSDSIQKGDLVGAGRAATNLSLDTSGAIAGFRDLAKAKGTSASKLAGLSRAGRFLGAAGAVGQLGYGVHDLLYGDKVEGAVGIASGIGTGMGVVGGMAGSAATGSVWASCGWMGPVGLGIAVASTIFLAGYGHVKGTKIARNEIGW